MKKNIKRILISFISLFFIGIIGFLCYYFFATYNSVKVYSIGGKSKNFYLQEGVMIVTKQKLFFKLGNLIHSDDIDIDKVTLSFKKNGKDKLIYDNHDLDRLIIENYGYEEYFFFDDLDDILKGIRLDIYYNDKIESINLDFLLILSNNKFVFNKKEIDINNKENKSSELEEDILKFMIKKGTYKDDYYEYKIENKTFKYYDVLNEFILERKSDSGLEIWRMNYNRNYLIYSVNDNYVLSDEISLCNDNNCSKNELELRDRFYDYLDRYILGKSN